MKRLTVALVVLAAASPAAFCVLRAPGVEAGRPALRLVTREVSLGRVHAGELKGTRTVSPDRRHVAFVAKVAGGEAAYADGVAGKTYPAIASDPLSEAGTGSPFTYSSDGRRVAYVGRKGGKEFVVLEGAAGTAYDTVANLDFTPDGRHAVYTARRRGRSLVVVDGVESREYDAFIPAREHEREGSLNVEGAGSLSILARRGSELLRVEVEVVP